MLAALRERDAVAADLARVLACWLVVILLVQAQAALQALVLGPAHRHVAAVTPAVHEHGSLRTARAAAHQLAHDQGAAHHHHAGDGVAVPAEGEAALDTAACVLMAALAPLAAHYGWPACSERQSPLAGAGWAIIERDSAPPRRPPRG